MTTIPRKLIYINHLGFVSMFKVVFTSCLLTMLAIFAIQYAMPQVIQQAHAIQEPQLAQDNKPVDPLVLKQEKIVEYIKNTSYPGISNETANKLADSILQVSWKYGIPVEIQLAIATHESKFDQYALGKAGELGFFQILPKAHVARILSMMQKDEIATKNIYDAYTNAAIAANILNSCLQEKKHNMLKSLACYNGAGSSTKYANEVMVLSKTIKPLI